MSIKQTKLFKQIKNELSEDIGRFVGDVEDIENWCESCLECPSNTLDNLLKQIPKENEDDWYDLIDEVIENLSDKMLEELSED